MIGYISHGNVIIINSTAAGLIKKRSFYKMSYFPESYTRSKNKIKVELDLSNYPTKYDLN